MNTKEEKDDFKDRMEKLKIYTMKQDILGDKLFDFEVSDENNEIYITKYYDKPERKEVVIPSFVDGIKYRNANDNDRDEDEDISFRLIGIFFGCKYLEKVRMGPNVKGDLAVLFCGFKGDKLDLSDFDTSNITNMDSMFEWCYAKHIHLGNKFNTSKVESMKFMFCSSKIRKLELPEYFNTRNVENMEGMFYCCSAEEINLGKAFYTSNVRDMSRMFSCSSLKKLDLGDNFDTSNVEDMSCMFEDCGTFGDVMDSITLGDKFHINNNNDVIFSGCKADKIVLGHKSSQKTVEYIKSNVDAVVEIKV